MSDQIVKYMTEAGEIQLSPGIIKAYLVSGDTEKVTEQEVMMFLQLCRYQKLNPFLREAYLIKFGNSPATIVTGKDVFTKRAAADERCGGWQAGVIVQTLSGEVVRRKGTLVLSDEKLVGGWAKVFRKDWSEPFEVEVSISEYLRRKSDGTPMSNWNNMPATMIRKVALVQALREAFPEQFQGLYSPEEMPIDDSRLNNEPINITPKQEPKQPIRATTPKKLTEQEIKRFAAIALNSGATEEVIKIILDHEIPNNMTDTGKFDWNKISREQYDYLCNLFESGEWKTKYQQLNHTEVA